jgi:DNA polymerase
MTANQTDMRPDEARQALSWLIAMGADEVIQDEPVNRFAATKPADVPPPPSPAVAVVAAASAAPPSSVANCRSIVELEAALAALEDCALQRTASHLCFAGGNLQGRTMVIGDVAGSEEDREGATFAGQSAALLERMLAAIGLSSSKDAAPPQAASLFNLIPWRPPGNRPVTPQEVELCLPFLLRAIELLQPRFILGFGGLPAQALLKRSDTLMAMRGKWFEMNIAGRSIPMISTFSPRMLLQQRAQKRLAWRDLLTLQDKMRGAA